MLHCQAETGWRAIVEDIDGVAIEADDLGEAVDRVRNAVEAVDRGIVRLAEARKVGRDDVVTIGKQRDQITEHDFWPVNS